MTRNSPIIVSSTPEKLSSCFTNPQKMSRLAEVFSICFDPHVITLAFIILLMTLLFLSFCLIQYFSNFRASKNNLGEFLEILMPWLMPGLIESK
jgi:hypothetical protein